MDFSIASWNEWDPLEVVVIGTASGAQVPDMDRSLSAINYANLPGIKEVPLGPYSVQVIEEANEDLDTLCVELRKLSVEVLRPRTPRTHERFGNSLWESRGYYGFCPRDSVLIHGSSIIETPMPLRSRYFENQIYHDIFMKAFKSGAKWISAPKPLLADESFDVEDVCRDKLTLRNIEPCFDAANVLRCGYDLFYLVSNSGNELGAQWLQSVLGTEYKVHVLKDIYSYMHIDSTLSFIRPGLVLLNPERIQHDRIPDALKSWDHIWCPEPVDIGYFGSYKHASPWIGMNLLMVNPTLAIVEENQCALIKVLEQNHVDVLPLRMRHARTLGGAFHCVSLDLKRKGSLERYF